MNTQEPLSPPVSAYIALLTLKDYYAPIAQEYEKLYTQAKTSLTHVEALLSNWATTDDLEKELFTQTQQENSSLLVNKKSINRDFGDITLDVLSNNDSASNFSDVATQEDNNESPPQFPLIETGLDDTLDTTTQEDDDESPPQFPLIETGLDDALDAATEEDDDESPPQFPLIETGLDDALDTATEEDDSQLPLQLALIETAPFAQGQSLAHVEIPMLPQYQSLSRREAIEQVLAEQIGTIVHIDFIVRSLYGELQPEVFKVVKGRVQSALTHGKETNKWFSVSGSPGYYTLSLTLLPKTKTENSTRVKRSKPHLPPQPKEIPMLKAYQGQFVIDALTTFLEQNAGQVFGIAEIINGIYGELSASDVREVKNKVLNELSRGHRTGRFFRVPSQLGVYTWDLDLINS